MELENELGLNAKLQQKKNQLRSKLSKLGILGKGGENKFDRYKYFSEAQYKKLFTDLFSEFNLEITSHVRYVEEFTGTEKMPFGRRVCLNVTLTDVETGFEEHSDSYGEGTDKGDKAIYKAMTGALKYWFANTFAVATGDDAENDSDDSEPTHITKDDMDIIVSVYKDKLPALLEARGLDKLESMKYSDGKELVEELKKKAKSKDTV